MPRKSRTSANHSISIFKRWLPAIYLRLSREDGDKLESDSIANQRALLTEYAAAQDDLAEPVFYQDDGFTGTNFNRPGFQSMLDDLRSGKVNCVIVKDLSRLGRNYVEVGGYLEKVFPLLGVRFISVNDQVDSIRDPMSVNTLIVPFKNIINDEYCRDISNKVRASLDLKRRQGKFIGSFASYGYRKDPDDHNHLLIDDEAAAVVRDIYRWFLGGTSIIGIAKRLNAQGIPNPSAYKRQQGFSYRHPAGDRLDGLWPDSSVRRILTNRLYTGTMVQGKNRIKSYKLPISERIPEANWIQVAQTHEAIIDAAQFEQVQSLLQRDTRTPAQAAKVHLFSGFLRCADCGKAMNRKTISQPYRDYAYYICSTFKKQHSGICTKHTIRSDKLERAVLETLRQQIARAVEMDELIASIDQNRLHTHSAQRFEQEKKRLTDERDRLSQMKLSLYPDWKRGDLSREEYLALKEQFDGQIIQVESRLSDLARACEQADMAADANAVLQQFIKYRNLHHLTREVVVELIDMIDVHEGGGITIHFKFSDALASASEYIKVHSHSA